MTKIDIFSGFLGAGKTTLIKKLIAEAYSGEKLVLSENEFGEINIDGGFLKESGIEISEMSAGCICCSLVGDFNKALKEVGEANAQIFEIHIMMLEDEDYNESIANIIDTQQVNAEYAVAVTSDNFAEMFAAMDDAYMQARSADVRDISNRIIANLTGTADSSAESCDSMIVCADDLAPSETVALDKDKVLAFVTAHGSSNSHTAILARNMNIPAVIGMGDEFLPEISSGTPAIVDGYTGTVIVDPDEATVAEYTAKRTSDEEKKRLLQELKGKENVTVDGRKINIYANISGIDNIGAVLLNDAGGIGLFRSEFLYLENSDFPTEEQQFHAYKRVLESMAGK